MKIPKRNTLISFIIVGILIAGLVFWYNPFLFRHVGSFYKTQEVIYRDKQNKNITIEIQMQDSGAFGYNRKIVKVTKGFIFNSTISIDTARIDKSRWERVDEYINKLELKGG